MSVVFMNTRKSQIAVGSVVGVALLICGGVYGVRGIAHAVHTAQRHQGQNMVYSVTGCGAPFGGDGSEWDSTFFMHNGNSDEVSDYSVQTEFDVAGLPVGYSQVSDMGTFGTGMTKSFHMEGTVNQKPGAAVSCKLLFFYNDEPAGNTAPVEAKG